MNLIFIGDVHGQFRKLNELFDHIAFDESKPPIDTKLVFVGDLIDNSLSADTGYIELLTTVKRLVDNGLAHCIMGNHEFNAVGWATKNVKTGEWLRPHNVNNAMQHQDFLHEVGDGSEIHQYWIDWFRTLPLFIDFEEVRVVHACWQQVSIDILDKYTNSNNQLKRRHWQLAFDKKEELHQIIEVLLKGPEIELPAGNNFKDKTGITRKHIRSKWWLPNANTYREIAQVQPDSVHLIPNINVENEQIHEQQTMPTFVGHYTLNNLPDILSKNVVCVDYNAAKGENPLVAYIWQGETELINDHFAFVSIDNG